MCEYNVRVFKPCRHHVVVTSTAVTVLHPPHPPFFFFAAHRLPFFFVPCWSLSKHSCSVPSPFLRCLSLTLRGSVVFFNVFSFGFCCLFTKLTAENSFMVGFFFTSYLLTFLTCFLEEKKGASVFPLFSVHIHMYHVYHTNTVRKPMRKKTVRFSLCSLFMTLFSSLLPLLLTTFSFGCVSAPTHF